MPNAADALKGIGSITLHLAEDVASNPAILQALITIAQAIASKGVTDAK